jgi:hypothetical protein
MRRTCRTAAIVAWVLAVAAAASAQESGPARIGADTVLSASMFSANDHVSGMFDTTVSIEAGKGLTAIVRPWAWRRPDGTSTFQWYQLQVRYQAPTRIPLRIDAGVITSPLGLSTLQQRADLNPVIAPVFYYVVPLPRFDTTFDALQMISAGYPLGVVAASSGARWDARAGVIDGTPARPRVRLKSGQRPAMPQFVAGGGFTPRAGLRVGAGLATGRYRDATAAAPQASATVVNLEAEYAVRHTRVSGEWVTDRFGIACGPVTARSFYVQGVQTLTPRLFAAARVARVRTPPIVFGTLRPTVTFTTAEATMGYRLTREWTLRGGYYGQRTYLAPSWQHQAAASVVWARRWY